MKSGAVEIRTLDGALQLLDEWMASYRELSSEKLKLESRLFQAEDECKRLRFLLKHLDPFLPDGMQNIAWRVADPKVYAALAELRLPAAPQYEFEPEPEYDPFA